jgi:hypothetical protein
VWKQANGLLEFIQCPERADVCRRASGRCMASQQWLALLVVVAIIGLIA